MDCEDGQLRVTYPAQKAKEVCPKTWRKNNQSKQFVGCFARVFQEGFKGMLYYVVICGNHFIIKWLGVYVECICCGSSSFLDHGVFNQGRDSGCAGI